MLIAKPKKIDISLHKIYSEDNFELDAILFSPKKTTKKVIVHVHGKEGHFLQNHFVTTMGYTYPLKGYSFLTFNNRGHDYIADMLQKSTNGFEWVQRGTAFDVISEAPFDINGVIDYLKELGYEEIILQGHSLGPHKICYYLANNPKHDVKKVILISTADIIHVLDSYVPDWRDYSKYAERLIDSGKENELMPVPLWSNSPSSAKTFWSLTNPNSDGWIFNFKYPKKDFKYFSLLKQSIFVVNPENDMGIGVSAKQAMTILKEKSSSIDFSSKIIENAVHNFASKETDLANVIIEWLQTK